MLNRPFAAGTVLDSRFVLGELVGSGGETFVHRATDTVTGEPVAIRQYQKADDETRRRCRRERSLRVCSQHVARHMGGGEYDGSYYTVVEFVEGRSVDQLLQQHPPYLPYPDALSILKQTAHGLADLHAAGLIHRDLKPANVLVRDSGLVKIIDLGLVRDRSRQTIANDGMARGTLHYMSPEHLTDPMAVDQRSDLYSLGAMNYQMLTGTLPFDGSTSAEIQQGILTKEPVRPCLLRPDLPASWESVTLKLLEKDPGSRFQSARQLMDHLDGRRGGGSCPACGASSSPSARFCAECGVDMGAVSSAAAMLRVNTSRGIRWLVVPPGGLTLGRAVLDPGNQALSACHAHIALTSGDWVLEDCGSTNGTWVDGLRVSHRTRLSRQSQIQLADMICVFWSRK